MKINTFLLEGARGSLGNITARTTRGKTTLRDNASTKLRKSYRNGKITPAAKAAFLKSQASLERAAQTYKALNPAQLEFLHFQVRDKNYTAWNLWVRRIFRQKPGA